MVSAEPDSSSGKAAEDGALGRLAAGRYLLGAALLALGAGTAFFRLPAWFSILAGAALIVVAVLAPRRRAASGSGRAGRSGQPVWPDTAMKATVEAFPKPTFLLDLSGAVRYVNESARRLFPATRPGDAFTLTFRRPEFAEALEVAAVGETSSFEFREPGGRATTYLATIGPVRSPGGGVGFVLISFDDVSDRLAIARMRADFVANASHELRTPLASLTGFIETLLGAARNDPVASEKFLRVMLDQARRMRRLIDDLLSLSRVEMRVHSRPTERVDLAAAVRHVGDAMQPVARENAVALTLDVPSAPVEVIGDRDELVQLAQNLVENAIRYGGSGGRVEVRLDLHEGAQPEAALHVRDYGPGIAPEHIPRLTERFYRVDVGASREMKGTGLGLAIVKHILTRHRGRLEIESRPGEGARFSAVIPLAAPAA